MEMMLGRLLDMVDSVREAEQGTADALVTKQPNQKTEAKDRVCRVSIHDSHYNRVRVLTQCLRRDRSHNHAHHFSTGLDHNWKEDDNEAVTVSNNSGNNWRSELFYSDAPCHDKDSLNGGAPAQSQHCRR